MGLFGKIKNILFEDDDEVGEMPVYTKEDVEEVKKTIEEENIKAPFDPNPIKTNENKRFNNVKRDIDIAFDDSDVLGEVPGVNVPFESEAKMELDKVPVEQPMPEPKEEKKTIFQSFDEDEFERLNSRVNNNEKLKSETSRETNRVDTFASEARRANNNFSSTTTTTEKKVDDPDRYKINFVPNGRKPFRPSPVISPVYGILDKNYKKDEIVDKKDGMKRERVVKPIVRKEPETLDDKNDGNVDIDSVRKKAYGGLELLEKNAVSSKIEVLEEKEPEVKVVTIKEEKPAPTLRPTKKEEIKSVEDELDDKDFEVTNVIDVSEEKEIEQKLESIVPKKETKSNKPKVLDDLEKTNTLQILDDIEKELNSIKPISKEDTLKEDEELRERIERSDTLENDLFNLIDSMYESGEEEE